MNHYIKYFFVIFGSISILQGSDNTNNNDFMLQCKLCMNKEGQGKKLKSGFFRGVFSNVDSFIVHFNRFHLHDPYNKTTYYKHIQTLPKNGEERTNFKLKYGAKKIKTEDSISSANSSPLLPPIGSPTLEHNKPYSSNDYKQETTKKVKKQKQDQNALEQMDLKRAAFILTHLPSKDATAIDASGGRNTLLGCDNNNNNNYFMYKCTLCTPAMGQGKKLKNGNTKGHFSSKHNHRSFNLHFNKTHLDAPYEETTMGHHLATLPIGTQISFKLQFTLKIEEANSISNDLSPLLSPMGSPTLEHSNPHSSDDSETELEEESLKGDKCSRGQLNKRRRSDAAKPKNSSTSTLFLENVYKETAKKVKMPMGEQTPNLFLPQHEDFELAAVALVAMKIDSNALINLTKVRE